MTDTINRIGQIEEEPYRIYQREGRQYLFRLRRMLDNGEVGWTCAIIWPSGSIDSCMSKESFPTVFEALSDARDGWEAGGVFPPNAYNNRIICNDHEEHQRAYTSMGV